MLKTHIAIRVVLGLALVIGANLAVSTPTPTTTPRPVLGWSLVEYSPDNHAHTVAHFATLTDCLEVMFPQIHDGSARSCQSARDILG